MEVVAFLFGTIVGVVCATIFKNQAPSIPRIEKDMTEQYRGETFERRAKRASK